MIRRRKDTAQLVAQGKLVAIDRYDVKGSEAELSPLPLYWHLYLWRDRFSMREQASTEALGPRVQGCCVHEPTVIEVRPDRPDRRTWPRRKLGEVHFVLAEWDIETVAHELVHALFSTMRFQKCPGFVEVYKQEPMAHEELAAYMMGRWVKYVVAWLSEEERREIARLERLQAQKKGAASR